MIPLLLFLLAVVAVYVGTIETAFSALMKLSLRLMAERGGATTASATTSTIRFSCSCRQAAARHRLFARHRAPRGADGPFRREPHVGRHAARVRHGLHPRLRALPAVGDRAEEPRGGPAALLPPFSVIARVMSPFSGGFVRLLTGGPERAHPAGHPGRRRTGGSGARVPRSGRRAGADRARRAPAAAVDRRLRRYPRPRGDDAASRHRRDP